MIREKSRYLEKQGTDAEVSSHTWGIVNLTIL